MNDELKQAGEIQLVAAIQLQTASTDLSVTFEGLRVSLKVVIQSFKKLGIVLVRSMRQLASNTAAFTMISEEAIIFKSAMNRYVGQIDRRIKSMAKVTPSLGQPKKSTGGTGGLFKGLQRDIGGIFDNLKKDFQQGKMFAGLKKGIPDALGGIVGVFKAPFKGIGTLGKGIGGQMKKAGIGNLGKQMLKLNLVMRPFMALFQGLLEPFEPLIEIFGAVGQIIGTLLYPVLNLVYTALGGLLPDLANVVNDITPVFDDMANAVKEGTDPIVWTIAKLAEIMLEAQRIQEENNRIMRENNKIMEENNSIEEDIKRSQDDLEANWGQLNAVSTAISSGQWNNMNQADKDRLIALDASRS